jgi:hypothetical protein
MIIAFIFVMLIIAVVVIIILNSQKKNILCDNSYWRSQYEDRRTFGNLMRDERNGLRIELATARKGLEAVSDLIGSSNYVGGLHLNGDPAFWQDLRTGGKYEEWLEAFDAALNDIPRQQEIVLTGDQVTCKVEA